MKVLLRQEFNTSTLSFNERNKTATVLFERALKIKPVKKYTLSISGDRPLRSYFGINGCVNTSDFNYFDSLFTSNM